MNFQQPALGANKSYHRQILTQLHAVCELAYTESEMPINTFMNNGERPQLCDQSLLFYSETRWPACQSLSARFDAQELSAEFANFMQPSTSLLNLPLNIKQTSTPASYSPPSHTQHYILIQLVGANGEESLILPTPQLLPCPKNSPLKSKADW